MALEKLPLLVYNKYKRIKNILPNRLKPQGGYMSNTSIKKCKITGCNGVGSIDNRTGNRYFTKGYCTKHYSRLCKHGDVKYYDDHISPDKCRIDGCTSQGKKKKDGSRYFVKGLCLKHYKRHVNNRDMNTSIREHRPAIIDGDIAKIPLGVNAKDGYAIVDIEYAYLDKHKWSMIAGRPLTSKRELIHHMIMGKPPKGLVVDHINRDPLDNRKQNLRFITQRQNSMNSSPVKETSSIYKGVYRIKNRWACQITSNGKTIYGGSFIKEEEAALAYNKLARKYFGVYAYLNEVNI